MPDSSVNTLSSKDAQLWIGGLQANADTTSVTANIAAATQDVSTIGSALGQTWKETIDGDITLSLLYKNRAHEQRLYRFWDDAVARGEIVTAVWSLGKRIAIGEPVAIACLKATDLSLTSQPKDVLRLELSAVLDGGFVAGVLKSTQTAAGNEPMTSTATSDFGLQAISNRGPATHTPTVAVDAADKAIGIIVTMGAQVGSDAARATVTFNLPLAWQGGTVPNSADNMVMRVTHKGVTRSTRVFYGGDQLSTIFNEISDFQWDDGFEINHESTSRTQVTFTANRYGTDENMIWEASNPAPFRGSFTGAEGGVTIQAETATGTGGARVYVGQGAAVEADQHDLPVSAVAIAPSAAQIGLRVAYPEVDLLSPAYNFSVRYNLAYAVDGVFV